MRFIFGSNKTIVKEAKDLKSAIEVFKVEELFPEDFADPDGIIEHGEYDCATQRYSHKYSPDTTINIRYYVTDKDYKDTSIKLFDCIEIDYSKYNQNRKLLGTTEESTSKNETFPIIGSRLDLQSISNKSLMRTKMQEIDHKKHELECMINELRIAKNAMLEELTKKSKLIHMLCTYLGEDEEIVQIAFGESSKDQILHVYQQLLYMDEEIGIYEDGGLDYTKIDLFDEWISKNYYRYLYKDLSVCAFQVRRYRKDYKDVRSMLSNEDKRTYFLIRNGSNIYRIYSNMNICERMFPLKNEFDELIEKSNSSPDGYYSKKLKGIHEQYLLGFFALQGMIDRSIVFGTHLKGKVNLISGEFNGLVELIRDDEPNTMLTDGKPTWDQFLKSNRSTISIGTRVVLTKAYSIYNKEYGESNVARYTPFKCADCPNIGEVYIVDEKIEKEKHYYGYDFKLYFEHNNETYRRFEGYVTTTRNYPYRFYQDEVINYDRITLEDIEYYFNNRLERKNYLSILPILMRVRRLKLKEREEDVNFIKLISSDESLKDKNISEVDYMDAINWWRLKNKWKRSLFDDSNKAIRMIKKRLLNEC